MKTKNIFHLGLMLIAALTLSLTSCNKDKTTSKESSNNNTQSMQQLTVDENNVENASDLALNDATGQLSPGKDKSNILGPPCNATVNIGQAVDDTVTIDIDYHGPDCLNKFTRTGHVVIKKKYSESWGTAGATVLVYMNNFTITKISNGKSLTLNGIKHFQNVSGHYLWQLHLDSTVTACVDRVWGNITATFDDGTTRVWNIARQRTFTGSLIALVMTIDGFGQADGLSNLCAWGTTRNSEQFYSSINPSVVHKMICGWDPCSGSIKHEIPAASKSITATFGYDNNFQLITDGSCPAYYKLDWVIGPNYGTLFLPL